VINGKPGEQTDIGLENEIVTHGHSKPKGTLVFALPTSIHASEEGFYHGDKSAVHQFKITLEPASYTDEKYALFDKYQKTVHHDHHSSPSGFRRFLVNTPLQTTPIPYPKSPPSHLPTNYGSYHQIYRVDGRLIAIVFWTSYLPVSPVSISSTTTIGSNSH